MKYKIPLIELATGDNNATSYRIEKVNKQSIDLRGVQPFSLHDM